MHHRSSTKPEMKNGSIFSTKSREGKAFRARSRQGRPGTYHALPDLEPGMYRTAAYGDYDEPEETENFARQRNVLTAYLPSIRATVKDREMFGKGLTTFASRANI